MIDELSSNLSKRYFYLSVVFHYCFSYFIFMKTALEAALGVVVFGCFPDYSGEQVF